MQERPTPQISESERNICLFFPGQGTHRVGMGRQMYDMFPAAREVYDEMDLVLPYKITRVSFEGPQDELNRTSRTQMAVVGRGAAAAAVYHEAHPNANVVVVAGHSAGEYNAIIESGAATLRQGTRLMRARGEALEEVAHDEKRKSGLIAVTMKVDEGQQPTEDQQRIHGEVLDQLLHDHRPDHPRYLSTVNSPLQQTVGLRTDEIDDVVKEFRSARGSGVFVSKVPVVFAFHTPFAEPAIARYRKLRREYGVDLPDLSDPTIPVISNVSGKLMHSAKAIDEEADVQLIRPVMFKVGMENAVRIMDVNESVELGVEDEKIGLVTQMHKDTFPGGYVEQVRAHRTRRTRRALAIIGGIAGGAAVTAEAVIIGNRFLHRNNPHHPENGNH